MVSRIGGRADTGLIADFVKPETKKDAAEDLARRKTQAEFKHELSRCCINGRVTGEIPCRNLPHCARRKDEPDTAPQKTASGLMADLVTPETKRRAAEEARERLLARGRGRPHGPGR